ncbi:disease resistance protein Pik-2-like isoform X2 [Oryza brachyantha]|uniref:disease resistance protein Pik-2-like isoform X2 n=1 Tax=Oryza brachyantha TaxID=4533 RepID=UPI001ADD3DB4|nr:disease resistance protein Pik-2-like isoform X2 [Oryza brachyantha]
MEALGFGAWNATMNKIINKLGDLAVEQYTSIKGVHGDIQYISDELGSMRAFLCKLSVGGGDHHDDEQTVDWMKQIRDVAYDIEDCIDNVALRLGSEPHGGCGYKLRRAWYVATTLQARSDIAAEIGDLKLRAQHIGERRVRYGVTNPEKPKGSGGGGAAAKSASGAGHHPPASFRERDRLLPASLVVGTNEPEVMKDDIGELVEWLSDVRETKKTKILAIVGFGGLGKTTLAMALYRKLTEQYDSRALVQMSHKLDSLELLRSILEQVRMPRDQGYGSASADPLRQIEGFTEAQIKSKIKNLLKKKSYFILIDDVWSTSSWQNISDTLPRESQGSIIVLTTRFRSVADACCPEEVQPENNRVYTLKPLTEEKSERIFLERAPGADRENFKDKIDLILKKCGGLPLAIVVVAGLLASNLQSKSHWENVTTSLSSSALESELTTEGVTQILDLCYDDSSSDYQTCLLYLSLFPKGSRISRKRLIRRWIAEGFIGNKPGKTVEEAGEDYFNELIDRNMVRPVDLSSNGKVKNIQVHDMILEYIMSKSSEDNFITVVGGHWLTKTPWNRVRRLSIQSIDREHGKTPIERLRLSHLRSLTAFESLKELPSFPSKVVILKILDLEGCKNLPGDLLDKICRMFHLRYLSLRKTDINHLPSRIGKLHYLEILDIRETYVKKLPTSVEHLKQLTHLLCGNKRKRLGLKLTQGITKMAALSTLSGIEIGQSSSTTLANLHYLTKVKKLSIYRIENHYPQPQADKIYARLRSAIQTLSSGSLKSLAVNDDSTDDDSLSHGYFLDSLHSLSDPPVHLRALKLSGKLSKIPKWIERMENLERLTLSLSVLRTNVLRIVGTLTTLFSLTFFLNSSQLSKTVRKTLEENTRCSGGEIFVPAKNGDEADGKLTVLFPSLRLLRFMTPVIPLLAFQEEAMPKLQRLELRFGMLEGVHGLENLSSLQQVLFGVNSRASQVAKEKDRTSLRIVFI